MLFVTIQDWPALGSISGQAFKGYKGCTWCMDETIGIWLKHCKKLVYMGHHRFVLADHAYQKNKKAFDGTIEKRRAQRFTVGNICLGWSRILKFFLERGKEEEVKRQRRWERMQRIMVTKLQDCSKKDQYFGNYHIGRT
jgi:hypothetical protein